MPNEEGWSDYISCKPHGAYPRGTECKARFVEGGTQLKFGDEVIDLPGERLGSVVEQEDARALAALDATIEALGPNEVS